MDLPRRHLECSCQRCRDEKFVDICVTLLALVLIGALAWASQ
jgi:hypothetical protein